MKQFSFGDVSIEYGTILSLVYKKQFSFKKEAIHFFLSSLFAYDFARMVSKYRMRA